MVNFIDIIQAPLRELQSFATQDSFESIECGQYAQILLAYMKAEDEQLANLVDECDDLSIRLLATIRHQILTNSVEVEIIEKLERLLPSPSDWQGEIAFTLGLAYLENEETRHALRCFKFANKHLWDLGARRKAVRALLNIVITDSKNPKTNKGIPGFEFVKEKAVEVGDDIIAGICSHHISKEHFKNKDFESSLKHINEALDLLSSDRGTPHFFEAALLRCQIYIELGRLNEANVDLQNSKTSRHPRILDSLRGIQNLLHEKNLSANDESTKQA